MKDGEDAQDGDDCDVDDSDDMKLAELLFLHSRHGDASPGGMRPTQYAKYTPHHAWSRLHAGMALVQATP